MKKTTITSNPSERINGKKDSNNKAIIFLSYNHKCIKRINAKANRGSVNPDKE